MAFDEISVAAAPYAYIDPRLLYGVGGPDFTLVDESGQTSPEEPIATSNFFSDHGPLTVGNNVAQPKKTCDVRTPRVHHAPSWDQQDSSPFLPPKIGTNFHFGHASPGILAKHDYFFNSHAGNKRSLEQGQIPRETRRTGGRPKGGRPKGAKNKPRDSFRINTPASMQKPKHGDYVNIAIYGRGPESSRARRKEPWSKPSVKRRPSEPPT